VIGDLDEPKLGFEAEFAGDPFDQGERRNVVPTAVEVEHLDLGTGRLVASAPAFVGAGNGKLLRARAAGARASRLRLRRSSPPALT
jgi:hypothetical protein